MKFGKYSTYKCFIEPFSASEAPSLASSSSFGGRGNPLKEARGEKQFHSHLAAKSVSASHDG